MSVIPIVSARPFVNSRVVVAESQSNDFVDPSIKVTVIIIGFFDLTAFARVDIKVSRTESMDTTVLEDKIST